MESRTPSAGHTYTIYPSDPKSSAELSFTRIFLQSLADRDIHDDWKGDKFLSWGVSLKAETSTEEIERHKGIRHLELQKTPPDPQPVQLRQERRARTWMAWATDPNNKEEVNKTREWLDSKVKDKSLITERKTPRIKASDREDRNVRAWSELDFDDEGTEEVKKQPGISSIEELSDLVDFRAVFAEGTVTNFQPEKLVNDVKRAVLEYIKQDNARKDVVMDIQYK
jgi:hypothetical protein